MSRRVRSLAKPIVSLTFLVLLLGACSSVGLPISYDDQTQTLEDGTEVSLVQLNWLEGCTVGLGDSDVADDANRVCECAYENITAGQPDGIPFDDFRELDDELRGDPASLVESESLTANEMKLRDFVQACICDQVPGKSVDVACKSDSDA